MHCGHLSFRQIPIPIPILQGLRNRSSAAVTMIVDGEAAYTESTCGAGAGWEIEHSIHRTPGSEVMSVAVATSLA